MTPAKCEIAMQRQSGIAKKVYDCVPVQEAWQAFQIMQALKKMTGSQADVRVVQGCLNDLVESGLVRETGRRFYQRVQVEEKEKQPEIKMPVAQKKPELKATEIKSPSAPLEILGELSSEIIGMAEHLKALARRVEDVALAIEQERESSSESLDKLLQLKSLLKGL